LVGVGKIAKDQHLPALATNPAFQLTATASRHGRVDGLASFPDIERMIAGTPTLDAVSLCAPPSVRAAMARAAISAGLAVMLEKLPGDRLRFSGSRLQQRWCARLRRRH